MNVFEEKPPEGNFMRSSVANFVMPLGLVAIGVAVLAAGVYIGDTDDAPGAALIGMLLMLGMVTLGMRSGWLSLNVVWGPNQSTEPRPASISDAAALSSGTLV